MLRSIFKTIFQPLEVKVTCYEIKSFLAEATDTFAKNVIEGKAIAIAQVYADKVEEDIRINKTKPEEVALRIINDAIRELLLSAEFHLYRGYLDSMGADILKVWDVSMSALCKKGYITDIQAKKDTEWLNSQIQGLG